MAIMILIVFFISPSLPQAAFQQTVVINYSSLGACTDALGAVEALVAAKALSGIKVTGSCSPA
jgi:hypothetical protein